MRSFLLPFVSILFLTSCQNNKNLTGTWDMFKVYRDGQDVTERHNPDGERFIQFKENQFETGGKPYGTNTGSYTFDSAIDTLYLDSDTGPEDDSRWKVEISGDTMHWKGFGTEWAESFELIHIKRHPKD